MVTFIERVLSSIVGNGGIKHGEKHVIFDHCSFVASARVRHFLVSVIVFFSVQKKEQKFEIKELLI